MQQQNFMQVAPAQYSFQQMAPSPQMPGQTLMTVSTMPTQNAFQGMQQYQQPPQPAQSAVQATQKMTAQNALYGMQQYQQTQTQPVQATQQNLTQQQAIQPQNSSGQQASTNQTPEQSQKLLFEQRIQQQQLYQQQLYQQQLYQQQLQAQQQQMLVYQQMSAMTNQGVIPRTYQDTPQALTGAPGESLGTVTKWFANKSSGWIRGNDGTSLFVHHSDIICNVRNHLVEGERVTFHLGWNPKLNKHKAMLVKPLEDIPREPVKISTEITRGIVTRWDEKGYGWIQYGDANENHVFVHASDLVNCEKLQSTQRVEFEIEYNAVANKPKAVRCSVIDSAEHVITGQAAVVTPKDAEKLQEKTQHTKRFAPY